VPKLVWLLGFGRFGPVRQFAVGASDLLGMLLLHDTGIRRNELRQIQVRDFDLQRRTLTVKGKGRKERTIPIRGRVVDDGD
jgi:integrase